MNPQALQGLEKEASNAHIDKPFFIYSANINPIGTIQLPFVASI